MFTAKSSYESGSYAASQAIGVAPHFGGLKGAWDIRPVFHREIGSVIARLPVLLLRVDWHEESTSQAHSAVFQLNEDDWKEFKQEIEKLDRELAVLRQELGQG